jgi:hypothetical protein
VARPERRSTVARHSPTSSASRSAATRTRCAARRRARSRSPSPARRRRATAPATAPARLPPTPRRAARQRPLEVREVAVLRRLAAAAGSAVSGGTGRSDGAGIGSRSAARSAVPRVEPSGSQPLAAAPVRRRSWRACRLLPRLRAPPPAARPRDAAPRAPFPLRSLAEQELPAEVAVLAERVEVELEADQPRQAAPRSRAPPATRRWPAAARARSWPRSGRCRGVPRASPMRRPPSSDPSAAPAATNWYATPPCVFGFPARGLTGKRASGVSIASTASRWPAHQGDPHRARLQRRMVSQVQGARRRASPTDLRAWIPLASGARRRPRDRRPPAGPRRTRRKAPVRAASNAAGSSMTTRTGAFAAVAPARLPRGGGHRQRQRRQGEEPHRFSSAVSTAATTPQLRSRGR